MPHHDDDMKALAEQAAAPGSRWWVLWPVLCAILCSIAAGSLIAGEDMQRNVVIVLGGVALAGFASMTPFKRKKTGSALIAAVAIAAVYTLLFLVLSIVQGNLSFMALAMILFSGAMIAVVAFCGAWMATKVLPK